MAYSLNGIGTKYYGREPVEGGYIATEYFVFLWLPLIPIKSILVVEESDSTGIPIVWSSKEFSYQKLDKLYNAQVKKHLFVGYMIVFLLIFLIPYLSDATRIENGQSEPERKAIELHNSANERHEAGDHESAVRLFSLSLDNDSADAITFFLRGNCLEELDDYNNALEDYSRSIQLEPGNLNYRIARADLYWQQGEFEFAMRDFDSSIIVDSLNSIRWYYKGILHYELEEYDYAIPLIKHSLTLDSTLRVALVYLGVCQLNTGDTTSAIYNYRKYVSLVDRNVDTLAMKVMGWLEELEN